MANLDLCGSLQVLDIWQSCRPLSEYDFRSEAAGMHLLISRALNGHALAVYPFVRFCYKEHAPGGMHGQPDWNGLM